MHLKHNKKNQTENKIQMVHKMKHLVTTWNGIIKPQTKYSVMGINILSTKKASAPCPRHVTWPDLSSAL